MRKLQDVQSRLLAIDGIIKIINDSVNSKFSQWEASTKKVNECIKTASEIADAIDNM